MLRAFPTSRTPALLSLVAAGALSAQDYDADYPPGTLTPNIDLALQRVEIQVPDKYRDHVPEGLSVNLPSGFRAQLFAADEEIVVLAGLRVSDAIAFYKGDMYVGEEHQVIRAIDADGDGLYEDTEVLVADLPYEAWHDTKTIVFDEQNEKLYVSVGSPCDLCRMEPRPPVLRGGHDGRAPVPPGARHRHGVQRRRHGRAHLRHRRAQRRRHGPAPGDERVVGHEQRPRRGGPLPAPGVDRRAAGRRLPGLPLGAEPPGLERLHHLPLPPHAADHARGHAAGHDPEEAGGPRAGALGPDAHPLLHGRAVPRLVQERRLRRLPGRPRQALLPPRIQGASPVQRPRRVPCRHGRLRHRVPDGHDHGQRLGLPPRHRQRRGGQPLHRQRQPHPGDPEDHPQPAARCLGARPAGVGGPRRAGDLAGHRAPRAPGRGRRRAAGDRRSERPRRPRRGGADAPRRWGVRPGGRIRGCRRRPPRHRRPRRAAGRGAHRDPALRQHRGGAAARLEP